MTTKSVVSIDGVPGSFTWDAGYVLDAAIAAGVQVPYNCRGGACGTCKAEILDGAVEHGWVMGFAITDDEIAGGRCLICSSKPRTGHLRLRMLNAIPRPLKHSPLIPAEYSVLVVATHSVTTSVRQITVQFPSPTTFRFDDGMYMEFLLPGIEPARPYSIATTSDPDGSPPDGLLSFLVGRHERGQASSYLHGRLMPGDSVRLRGPYGTFRLPESTKGPVVMLASGTGLAPILSMLRRLLAQKHGDTVELLLSVRTRSEILLLNELTALSRRHPNFTLRIFLTREGACPLPEGWRRGRITSHLADFAGKRVALVLIAGSPGFVETCAQTLQEVVPEATVLTESYDARLADESVNEPKSGALAG